MGGLLLPRAAPLLRPRAKRWEAPGVAASLLLRRVCRWEALAAAAPLLLLHLTTRNPLIRDGFLVTFIGNVTT
jgi:hypothetical protein